LTLGFAVDGGPQLAAQAAAPPPLALFGDLRWLLVYERSWPTFAAGLLLLLLLRPLLTAAQARLAWPDLDKPRLAGLWWRSLAFEVVVGALLSPFALMVFALGAFPVSWLFFAAVPPAIVLSLLLCDGGLVRGSWLAPRRARPAASMAVVALAVSAAGAASSLGPRLLALPAAAGAGLVEAAAWSRVAGWLASTPPLRAGRSRRGLLLSPPALVAWFLLLAVGGAATGFALGTSGPQPGTAAEAAAHRPRPAHPSAVLVVQGFSSRYDGTGPDLPVVPAGDELVEFSYAGLAATGAPLPYQPGATHASLLHLSRLMSEQVDHLRAVTGRPVAIVAVSEGSAVVESYLARASAAPISAVVLVSPLVDPGRVSYPPPGTAGWGMVAGMGLAVMDELLGPISAKVDLAPEQPFLRSLLAEHAELAGSPANGGHRRPAPELAILPLADAVSGPPSLPPGVKAVVTLAFHGGNLTDPAVSRWIDDELSGRPVPDEGVEAMLDRAIAAVCSAWRVPSLPSTAGAGPL
jgi:hypothetical protein